MISVILALSLQVPSGPQIAVASAIAVEAHDLIKVGVEPDGKVVCARSADAVWIEG
jgi:hypothetical protein